MEIGEEQAQNSIRNGIVEIIYILGFCQTSIRKTVGAKMRPWHKCANNELKWICKIHNIVGRQKFSQNW
jgi:hypothetical protein